MFISSLVSPAPLQNEGADLSEQRNRAEVWIGQGRIKEAEALLRDILAREEGNSTTVGRGTALTLNDLGNIYRMTGRESLAENAWRRSLTIFEGVSGPHHPDVAVLLFSLGDLKSFQRQFREAEALISRAQAILERVAPADPRLGAALCYLATAYAGQRQFDKSEVKFEQALLILEGSMGPEHTEVAICLNRRARLLTAQKRYVEAEVDFRRAQSITEKHLGPEHLSTLTNLEDYAALLRRMKRPREASLVEHRAKEARERNGFSRHAVDWREITSK